MHTPGPWTIWNEHLELNPDTAVGDPLITAPGEDETQDICTINADVNEFADNARLIAAAPELLAAAENILSNPVTFDSFEMLRAAVAKARP